MKVYRKKSTFKGASENDYYFSGTNPQGNAVILKFKGGIPEDFIDEVVFEVTDIIGSSKKREVESCGIKYTNYTYYVDACKFEKIKGEPLPF